jgi:hypothetical protein
LVKLPWRPAIVRRTWHADNEVTPPLNPEKWLCVGALDDHTVDCQDALIEGAYNLIVNGDHGTVLTNPKLHEAVIEHINNH